MNDGTKAIFPRLAIVCIALLVPTIVHRAHEGHWIVERGYVEGYFVLFTYEELGLTVTPWPGIKETGSSRRTYVRYFTQSEPRELDNGSLSLKDLHYAHGEDRHIRVWFRSDLLKYDSITILISPDALDRPKESWSSLTLVSIEIFEAHDPGFVFFASDTRKLNIGRRIIHLTPSDEPRMSQ